MSTLPTVLCISGPKENWYEICKDFEDQFIVEQAKWEEIAIVSYPKDGPVVTLYPSNQPIDDRQKKKRVITPSLINVRMLCRYCGKVGTDPDFRNILYGFFHANIPIINTFDGVYMELERPIMMGRLFEIQKRLGANNFPVVPQFFYSDSYEMVITPDPPYVIKVSFPHAGIGKLCVHDASQFSDIKSLLRLHNDYVQVEPFLESEYEVRIVFIAPNYYRAHRRVSSNWKVNYGAPCIIEDMDFTPKYKMWIDEIRKAMPYMESFCIDSLMTRDGKEYILEINGSSQGLSKDHIKEAHLKLIELIKSKLNKNSKEEPAENQPVLDSDKDLQILNLTNKNNFLESELESLRRQQQETIVQNQNKAGDKTKTQFIILFVIIGVLIVALILSICLITLL